MQYRKKRGSKDQSQNNKRKKPTKKELTEIEKLKEELRLVKLRLKVEGVSKKIMKFLLNVNFKVH